MYKVDFSLSEWNFTIYFNTEEDYVFYKKQIEQSVSEMNHKKTNNPTIEIYYQNDKDTYNQTINKIKKNQKKVVSTFMNEYYEVYDDTYVSSKERYLIRREAPNTYRMICKEYLKRPECIYLIREIYVRLQENKKALFMHGNGIEIEDKGIMLLGNSGSGKTTFMLKLLDTDDNTSFLSNDRVFLKGTDTIDYFPIPLILANGTAKHNQRIFNYLKGKDSLYDSRFSKDILLNGSNNEKYALFRQAFFEIFPSCKSKEKSQLDYVILTKLDFSKDHVEIRKLEDIKKIIDGCFTPVDTESKRIPWILQRDYNEEELYANRDLVINNLLEKDNIYECFYHPDIDSHELQSTIKQKILRRNG